jgi:hypothetical protein
MTLKRYDALDFFLIENKWGTSVNPISVYVHSPFCPSICKFCIYAGNLLKDPATYSAYYENYLPKIVAKYKNTLEAKQPQIKSWFFGGGTPSLMSAETMRNVFGMLPGFKESSAVKTFEIHPAYWSIEQLDILAEYNFDNAVICLQTFDRPTLIKQKRVPAEFDNVVALAKGLKDRDINVFVDVIAFLNREDSDAQILENDLALIYTNLQPDEISVQTIYQNKEFTDKTILAVLESQFVKSNEYRIQHMDKKFLLPSKTDFYSLYRDNMHAKCFRLYKGDVEKIKRMNYFTNFMDPQYVRCNPNFDTLSLGSYKNPSTQTHSNIGGFNYFEINDDNTEPSFKYVRSSFFDEARAVLDTLEQLGEPEWGFELNLINDFHYKNENPIVLKATMNTPTQPEYLSKAQEAFKAYTDDIDMRINKYAPETKILFEGQI